MYNYGLNLKKIKKIKIKQILNQYNYIFFCKNDNLTLQNKLILKQNHLTFYNIKSNLFFKDKLVKGQGPILLIFFNNFKMINILKKNNINILFFLNKNLKKSILYLNKIFNKPFLIDQLNKPLFILYLYILYIQKSADIT